MSATALYRIAAVLLILFAAGHTVGFLGFKPPSQEALAVRDAMDTVRFEVKGTSFSYGGFYRGFGLFVTAYLLFSAFLAWYLGGLARTHPQVVGSLGWMFCGLQVVSFALSWIYFSVVPAVFSGVVSACLGAAAWLAQRSRSAPVNG